jgi:hypothetical protein
MNALVTFGELKVICEGYDFSTDPYVLAGSCGVTIFIENAMEEQSGFNCLLNLFKA